jgi:UDP-N-acetylmuramoyl-L-alanyl-D-glutamate--2,6-diaminopimelate ligase
MMAALATHDLTLGELVGADVAGDLAALPIADLVLDSRQVTAGAAFVALAGARTHGLDHADAALARGAAVVLYEPEAARLAPPLPSVAVPGLRAELGTMARRFFGRVPEPVVTAVTGTNGKTTVAYLLAQAYARLEQRCGYIGTLGFGVPPRLTEHALTTPDVFTLHREIAELGTHYVALEASSHALEQDRIAGVAIDTAVFTNLTHDHLDAHGDLASYGRAKQRLFRARGLRHAVVNADDPFGATIASALPTGCDLLRTSIKGAAVADLHAHVRPLGLRGLELDIGGRFGAARLASPLVGEFNAENLLVALGALLAQGRSLPAAVDALAAAHAAPGRMDVLGGPPHPWVVVDYAHTPDALERVLTELARASDGAVHCVFGCGGDRDRAKRPLMGAIAARLADRIVLTDDNPRGESAAAIVAEIRAGAAGHGDVTVMHDRAAAIRDAIEHAVAGDAVLVAGKGHERTQVVGATARPFDDRAATLAALAAVAALGESP